MNDEKKKKTWLLERCSGLLGGMSHCRLKKEITKKTPRLCLGTTGYEILSSK